MLGRAAVLFRDISPPVSNRHSRFQTDDWRVRVYPAQGKYRERMVRSKFDRRRRHERIPIAVPATVRAQGHTLAASTRDISIGGLFLFTDAPFQPGAEIEIVLMLPRELGLPSSEMVCCHGTVVRVEVEAGRCGVAATIDRIADLPQL